MSNYRGNYPQNMPRGPVGGQQYGAMPMRGYGAQGGQAPQMQQQQQRAPQTSGASDWDQFFAQTGAVSSAAAAAGSGARPAGTNPELERQILKQSLAQTVMNPRAGMAPGGGGEYDPMADAPARRPATALAMAAGGRGYGGGFQQQYGGAAADMQQGPGGAGRGYRQMQQPAPQQQMGARYGQQPALGARPAANARFSPAGAAMPSPSAAGFGPPVDVRFQGQAPDAYGGAAPVAGQQYGRGARDGFSAGAPSGYNPADAQYGAPGGDRFAEQYQQQIPQQQLQQGAYRKPPPQLPPGPFSKYYVIPQDDQQYNQILQTLQQQRLKGTKWSRDYIDPLSTPLPSSIPGASVHHNIGAVSARDRAAATAAATGAATKYQPPQQQYGADDRGSRDTRTEKRPRSDYGGGSGPPPGRYGAADVGAGRKRSRGGNVRSRSPSVDDRSVSTSHSAPRRSSGAGDGSSATPAFDRNRRPSVQDLDSSSLSVIPPYILVDTFRLPAVSHDVQQMSVMALHSKFPKLYIPADFISLQIDWLGMAQLLEQACFSSGKVACKVPVQFENKSPVLLPASCELRVSQTEPDLLISPHFSYLTADVANGMICNARLNANHRLLRHQPITQKPVKFQVRVLVCCGMKDAPTTEKNLARKLRILCGHRRGNLMLLGCPWSYELDGGDPLEEMIDSHLHHGHTHLPEDSCLRRTAKRALYSQALLRVRDNDDDVDADPVHSANTTGCINGELMHMCTLNYHRPREVINDSEFPEQEECTSFFLCIVGENGGYQEQLPAEANVVEDDITTEHFEYSWRVFRRRIQGTDVGPTVNRSAEDFDLDMINTMDVDPHPVSSADITSSQELAAACTESEAVAGGQEDTAAAAAEVTATDAAEVVTDGDEVADTGATADGDEAAVVEAADGSDQITNEPDATVDAEQSAAIDTTTENKTANVVESTDEEVNENKAADAVEEKVTPQIVVAAAPPRPEKPTLLICPMPLHSEILDDPQQRPDAVSLRMLPLHSLLSYSQSDRNERIFEVSIAAEMLRSTLSIMFANVIADVILCEHEALWVLTNDRVLPAIKKLRMMNKTSTKITEVIVDKVEDVITSTESKEIDAVEVAVTVDENENKESDAMETDDNHENKIDEAMEGIEEKLEEEEAIVSSVEVSNDEHHDTAAEDTAAEDVAVEEVMEVNEVLANETEALNLQNNFIEACRWFDLAQSGLLPYQHLLVVLRSSTRHISRADAEEVADKCCIENDSLPYEKYLKAT